MKPKKPNSARRRIAKVKLTTDKNVTCRVQGKNYLCSKYSKVLVNGGRANDLPGVGYTIIRGVYDFSPVLSKVKRRSIYGVRRMKEDIKYIRRKDRKKNE